MTTNPSNLSDSELKQQLELLQKESIDRRAKNIKTLLNTSATTGVSRFLLYCADVEIRGCWEKFGTYWDPDGAGISQTMTFKFVLSGDLFGLTDRTLIDIQIIFLSDFWSESENRYYLTKITVTTPSSKKFFESPLKQQKYSWFGPQYLDDDDRDEGIKEIMPLIKENFPCHEAIESCIRLVSQHNERLEFNW